MADGVSEAKAAAATLHARKVATLEHELRPLRALLDDEAVEDIMLNPDGSVWVKRIGHDNARSSVCFGPAAAERLARAIAAVEGGELNKGKLSLACKLPGGGGARAQIVLPPVVDATTVVLRRHRGTVLSLAHYVEQGVMRAGHASALERAVRQRLNILVGGGTGSGKTTLTNALLSLLAGSSDRVITIEDTAELQLDVPHRVAARVIKELYSWQDALVDAMRMRPDRIVLGEVRGGAAAIELLTALNTGHPGSISTIHADSAALMLDRYCRMLEQVVPHAPRVEVATALHVLVHLREDDASPAGRVVTEVLRVHGFVRRDISAERRCRYERQGIELRETDDGYWLLQDMEGL